MSIFSGITGAAKSTAVWIEKELTKVAKVAPTALSVIDDVLSYASLLIEIIVEKLAGMAAEEEAVKVLTEVRSDIKILQAALYDTGASGTISSYLDAIIANLKALAAVGHISNPDTLATLTKVLTELDVIAKKIESLYTADTATSTTTA
jgi:hypothetical protein